MVPLLKQRQDTYAGGHQGPIAEADANSSFITNRPQVEQRHDAIRPAGEEQRRPLARLRQVLPCCPTATPVMHLHNGDPGS